MGTKISALTETGSAPTGAYYPLEYDNANYKISTETLRANLGGKYTADWAQSHGGVDVANTATLPITHNLGTTNVIVQVFVNSSASDTNAQTLLNGVQSGTASVYGAVVTNITATEVTLQLGYAGYIDVSSGGGATQISFTTGPAFIKVVVLSAGTTSPSYDSGWSASTVTNADTVTLTHNLGRTDLTAQIWLSRSIESTKGDNPFQADLTWDGNADPYGATITNLTTTEVTLQVGVMGINYLQSNGHDANAGTCYYRIILTPAGASGGTATRGGGGDTGASMGNNETRNFLIGDLGDQQQILISASMRYSKQTAFPGFFQISATFGYPDTGATPVLAASVNSTGYTTAFGETITNFYNTSDSTFAKFYLYVSETQAFIQVQTFAAGAGDIFWSYKTF